MSSEALEETVEAEVWKLLDGDDQVDEKTVYLVAGALAGDDELAEQLGDDAVAPKRPSAQETESAPEPLRAFLRSITVEGFRGIGPRSTLELNPFCGITVISGRNGSGKSSFAEALEYALTGQSYRWVKKKGQHWEATWRNLHQDQPTAIVIDFAMEPDSGRDSSQAAVGVDWDAGAELSAARRWSQIKGQRRGLVSALGWDQELVTHRPLMSYDELGGLLEDGQSALFDALTRLLGLDEIADADNRLKDAEKRLGVGRQEANKARTELGRLLDGCDDPRAAQVKRLIARKPYDLDAVVATTLGTGTDQAATIARLRRIAALELPDESTAGDVASELRASIDAHAGTADTTIEAMTARATLLREALHLHESTGEITCPVCETGTLDDAWHAAAQVRLQHADLSTAEHQAVTQRLSRARTAAEGFFAGMETVSAVDGVELATLAAYNETLTRARTVPQSLAELPSHLELAALELAETGTALRSEAAERADELEDSWAPVARRVAAWTELESTARADDERLEQVSDALKWLRANADKLRQQRLAPIVDQAQHIWGRMRHESNVDLGGISLSGTANRRRAVVEGTVDGVPVGALSVMSQGELHALALALFIPRATAAASPFRFLVLDDPIQAMDPAKIDGFLDVLVELAKDRQVIVFSHDDRLPAAIRARSIDAQLLDVTREQGSVVVVKENESPAHRYIADADALIRDENLDDMVKSRAVPGLFRLAVEAAAHQRYFTNQANTGVAHQASDVVWEATRRTQQRVALAVTGDPTTDLRGWKSRRDYRSPTLAIAAAGAHSGAAVDGNAIRDLRNTVRDIVAGQ
ncbi:MAG: AAA family ATPase [Gordonia amarae]